MRSFTIESVDNSTHKGGRFISNTPSAAAKKAFTCIVDYAIETFDLISVSAGARGIQLVLAPADYLRAASASLADIGRSSGERIDSTWSF